MIIAANHSELCGHRTAYQAPTKLDHELVVVKTLQEEGQGIDPAIAASLVFGSRQDCTKTPWTRQGGLCVHARTRITVEVGTGRREGGI